MAKKMEIDPIASCRDCGIDFNWLNAKQKKQGYFQISKKMLKRIKCPQCGGKFNEFAVREIKEDA